MSSYVGQNVRGYVVNVSMEDDDPLVFGPYTRRRAEELAEQFNARIDVDAYGGFVYATAKRIDNPSITAMLREFGQ